MGQPKWPLHSLPSLFIRMTCRPARPCSYSSINNHVAAVQCVQSCSCRSKRIFMHNSVEGKHRMVQKEKKNNSVPEWVQGSGSSSQAGVRQITTLYNLGKAEKHLRTCSASNLELTVCLFLLLSHDWLMGYTCECAGAQVFLIKWMLY